MSSSSSSSSSSSASSGSGGGWWDVGLSGGVARARTPAPAAPSANSSITSNVFSAIRGFWNSGSQIIENVRTRIATALSPVTLITSASSAINSVSNVAPSVIKTVHTVVGGKLETSAPAPTPPQPAQPAARPEPVTPAPPTKPTKPWDRLIPFVALAPATVAISIFSYLIWKYFAQLRKIRLYRRAPLRIPGPSVQEQLLDHVEEAGPHEYQLVKERKPPSVPARTKRSGRDPADGGRVNRRTIIKIHFELVDECQKGNTKLTQNDFLELLVQEFMGSELMEEEEQVSKEEVLMQGVPMESVPMERVPILGSVFMV
ncbi:SICAvar, type I (fragment) [Plasmodium knowlesi strain H]|uniref:SICAvar, type I n=2 Tax=Plasmodium knowlesi (strain H) TaxID=5851 RepID=A0A5E7WUT9_PLAKH